MSLPIHEDPKVQKLITKAHTETVKRSTGIVKDQLTTAANQLRDAGDKANAKLMRDLIKSINDEIKAPF